MSKFKDFFKEDVRLFYSLLLILLIPILIIISSFWQIKAFENNMQTEVQNQTETTAKIVAGALSSSIDDPQILQSRIDEIIKTNP